MINITELMSKLPQEPREVGTIPDMGFFYRETASSHEYYYDKKKLIGVTTALNSIAKPALLDWAVKLAVEYIKEVYKNLSSLLPKHFEDAIIQHTLKKEAAADVGTIVHDACEQFLKHGIDPKFEPGVAHDCFENFRKWWGTDKKLIASEQKLYNLEYWYAGTCDFIYEQNGEIWLGDIKTSGAKKDHKSKEEKYDLWDRTYHAQTAAYQYAYENLTNKKISGRIVVRVGKDGSFSTHISHAFEQDFIVFLSALAIYKYNK